jgi:ferric-dicitrate binding protein FerR (iron transport regulator)
MDKERVIYLINAYREDKILPEEQKELFAHIAADKQGKETIPLLESLLNISSGKEGNGEVDHTRWRLVLEQVLTVDRPEERSERGRLVSIRRWWMAAAVVLVLAVTGGLMLFRHPAAPVAAVPVGEVPVQVQDAMPGGNKAVLTLSGGQKIVLDSTGNGQVAVQGASRVHQAGEGRLVYERLQTGETLKNTPVYNTLTTPRGGQYRLTLSDGTQVWLNAASSITYPTAFTADSRDVQMTGEVYFEVASNINKPFRVRTGGEEIDVLGTTFNVNAYTDEAAVRTSLLEGAVKVRGKLLRPGQACMNGQVFTADVDKAIAWKRGYFDFNGADIFSVMRQISRWYDVEVIYKSDIPDIRFGGEVKRDLDLSEVLRFLENLGVHFSIRDKQLTVMP